MSSGGLVGHDAQVGGGPARRSPFAPVTASIAVAVAYLGAALMWVVAGGGLPGGRWLAVHLFTLGVLSNLVLGLSEHFGRTLTRTPDESAPWHLAGFNLGVVLVLVGLPTGRVAVVALGATIATAVVAVAYLRLRRMRHRAIGARFAWVVRLYERAHSDFLHAAILGGVLGAGLLTGGWYTAGRLAHLHLAVLGWGVLTLLATLVFFGPTIVRTRILPGADGRAARALRHGATGVAAAGWLLLASGVGGDAGAIARWLAAAAIAVLAWAAFVVCVPVIVAARRAEPSAARLPVVALSCWLLVGVCADVLVVATGSWRYLDAVGLVLLVGVLGQAIVATVGYLAPMLRVRELATRRVLLERLERGARARTLAYNGAVATLAVVAAARPWTGDVGSWTTRSAWLVIVLLVLGHLLAAAWPLPRTRVTRRGG